MLVDVPSKQKPAPGCVMSFATESWLVCLFTFIVKGRWFHSVQIIPSLIGEKAGVKRNHFQKVFRKCLGAAQFVRLSLLYAENDPNRSNMAIMQDCPARSEKIAKMQDRIKLQNMQSDFGYDVEDILATTLPKIRSVFLAVYGPRQRRAHSAFRVMRGKHQIVA